MSETKPKPKFNVLPPAVKAARAALQAQQNQEPSREVASEHLQTPNEGGLYEEGGQRYRFVPATYQCTAYTREGYKYIERPYTLRRWFSHTVETPDGYINGPGWDQRLGLSRLAPEQMLRRYGHVFTNDEIYNPIGEENRETGELTGGMPDDIPYFEIEPI